MVKDGYSKIVEFDNTISTPPGCPSFETISNDEVKFRIKSKLIELENHVNEGQLPFLDIPLRRRENIVYDEKGRLFLGNKTHRIEWVDPSDHGYNEFAKTIRMIELIYENLKKGIISTKRDLFYHDVDLFETQKLSDRVLDNVAVWLGCSRNSLNVRATVKGLITGNVQYKIGGKITDFSEVDNVGRNIIHKIEYNIDKIEEIQGNAEFIFVIEKDFIFDRLAYDNFTSKYHCIMITAKGAPDVVTRSLIKLLVNELKIPLFGLMDADYYGLSIMSTYAHGSVQMAYETPRLCHNNSYWLGLRPSQLTEYDIPPQVQIRMSRGDEWRLRNMLELPNFNVNPKVVDEMEQMLEMGTKAELQALNFKNPQFISEVYLPQALDAGDFIKF